MITRGYILVSYPLDRVKDTVLETCKEMNAEVREVKKNSNASYQIEVETASIFDKAFRVGNRFQIRLQDKQQKTLIDVYDSLTNRRQRKQTMKENLGAHNNHHTNKFSIKPIDILKVRLAKGEITKGEYEELRKMVEL